MDHVRFEEAGTSIFFFLGTYMRMPITIFLRVKRFCFGSLNGREIFLAVLLCMNILGQVWLQDIFFLFKITHSTSKVKRSTPK